MLSYEPTMYLESERKGKNAAATQRLLLIANAVHNVTNL